MNFKSFFENFTDLDVKLDQFSDYPHLTDTNVFKTFFNDTFGSILQNLPDLPIEQTNFTQSDSHGFNGFPNFVNCWKNNIVFYTKHEYHLLFFLEQVQTFFSALKYFNHIDEEYQNLAKDLFQKLNTEYLRSIRIPEILRTKLQADLKVLRDNQPKKPLDNKYINLELVNQYWRTMQNDITNTTQFFAGAFGDLKTYLDKKAKDVGKAYIQNWYMSLDFIK